MTFSLHISGSANEINLDAHPATFNLGLIALVFMKPGTLDRTLPFVSPNNILCSFYWGIGADSIASAPLTGRISSFPVTLTGTCAPGADFDWAIYIRPAFATLTAATFNYDFSETLDFTDKLCGGHGSATGLRLYFDSGNRPSRLDATPECSQDPV